MAPLTRGRITPKRTPDEFLSPSAFSLVALYSIDQGGETSFGDVAKSFLDYMFCERDCQGESGDVEFRFDETSGRRGIFVASEKGIAENEYIFAVPSKSAWIVEREEKGKEELSDAARGFLFWKWQQQQQQQAFTDNNEQEWEPYIRVLPTRKEAFDPTPDFWTEEQIRALELPIVVERALSKRKCVDSFADETLGGPNQPIVSKDDLRFATWLVNSRAITIIFETREDDCDEDTGNNSDDEIDCDKDEMDDDEIDDDDGITSMCVLVPLLDMINHSSENPNAYFAVLGDDDEEGDDSDNEENLYYAVVATRQLHQGEEVLISYGSEEDSSVELLLQYGFVPETNPFDVDFWETFYLENDASKDGDKDITFWSTTLQDDEDRLESLEENTSDIDRTILQFRIRMKRAYAEWKTRLH